MTDRATRTLLRDLRSQVVPVDPPEAVAARRGRTVARLRDLQTRHLALGAHTRALPGRRRMLAALVLIPSVALAATWMANAGPDRAPVAPAGALRRVRTVEVGSSTVAGPSSAPPANVTPPPTLSTAGPSGPAAVVKPRPRNPIAGVTRTSTLRVENDLMRAALSAGRQGDDASAVTLLSEFLERYPRSPLAQNAELERLRALSRRGDPTLTRRMSRAYLERHPDGMARDEAHRLMDPSARPSPGTETP